eukprot:CAMPEP_0202900288 /NCGR_PEP_ID=MMETSP1392-20130828/10909_1 /ASSEMBLY_ACC=CAM_ASM_000868 /TAXON_ID=225041 /ORGANISM="Chlamydomonas chlamydogama, Strain SAG 11-48b" /LENGTH=109 /DNA_ID=CAMNT_0049586651 /DNA_START=62 /DNA_END=391 /DNA_ORIENTATION=+
MSNASWVARGLKENVAKLPPATGVRRISIPTFKHTIEPMPGKMASVAIYNHLATKYGGKLNKQAAQEGLDIYAEFVEEARQHAGSHPNIDLLFKVIDDNMVVDVHVDKE